MEKCEGTVLAMNQTTAAPASPTVSVHHRNPAPESPMVPVLHRSPPSPAVIQGNPPKHARKDRGPNWLLQEVLALVNAKREMFLEKIDIVDARDLMNPDSSKWQRVSQEVMRCGFSSCPRDGAACKTKWNQIIPEYKRIADFFARIGRNGADYWDLSVSERKIEGLPHSFPQDVFNNIHKWYGTRPSMQPPHTRDLLSHDDGNQDIRRPPSMLNEEVEDTDPQSEDPMDIAEEVEGTENRSAQTPPPQL